MTIVFLNEEIIIIFATYWTQQWGMCSAEQILETLQRRVYLDTILRYKHMM